MPDSTVDEIVAECIRSASGSSPPQQVVVVRASVFATSAFVILNRLDCWPGNRDARFGIDLLSAGVQPDSLVSDVPSAVWKNLLVLEGGVA